MLIQNKKSRMNFKLILLFAFIMISICLLLSFTSASSFGYNYLEPGQQVISGANYSINVNNTEHLQGRDTNQLYLYFKSLFDTVYCKLTGCTMTGDITFSNSKIINVNSVGYNTTYVPTGLETTGTSYYDNASHTLSTVLEEGVILQNGQELHVYGKNAGGVDIHNGDAVSITNVGGSFTTFALTNATDPVSAYAFVGLATEDIPINSFGYVTSRGVVRDINTDSWTEGLPLYVNASSPGHLTQTYPTAPNFVINAGVVEYKSINHGKVNVVPVVVPRLQDLSDTDGYPLNTTGQIYVWNDTRKVFDANFNINDYLSSNNINFTTLINDSLADTLHRHSELSASDGDPDPALSIDTSGKVGVGTTSPASKLHVIETISTTPRGFLIDQISENPTGPATAWRKARGNSTNPTYVKSGDNLGFFGFRGWYSTVGFASSSSAYIQAIASEDFNGSTIGGYLQFGTTATGATSGAVRMTLLGNGNLGLGTNSPGSKLEVVGNSSLGGNTIISGNLNQTSGNATINNIYGEIWNKSDTGFFTVDLVSVDTYVPVDNLTSGSINGFNHNNYNLTAQYAGVYKVGAKFGIIASGGAGGDNGMMLFINSAGQNNCYDHEHTSSTQPIGFIIDCIVRLNIGDNVSIRFDDHQSPVTDLIALNGNINLMRIGN